MIATTRRLSIAVITSALIFTGGGMATATPSVESASIVEPQVAKVWHAYQTNFKSYASCSARAFFVAQQKWIFDTKCLKKGADSADRWALWVYVIDE